MGNEARVYNWQPMPDEITQKIKQLNSEAQAGDAQHVARTANTIFATPSTLLVGEMIRAESPAINFHAKPAFSDDADVTLEQYKEYERIYNSPKIIGRFMGCVAFRGASGNEELGCEISVETHTGGFLLAQAPFEAMQIEVEAVDGDEEARAAEDERMLGESFRYLKKCVVDENGGKGDDESEEAFYELEQLVYGDVDLSAAESSVAAAGLHIRGIGIWSTLLLNKSEIVGDETALKALKFILETSILEVGESYNVKGQSSDTELKDGALFANNVSEVQLWSALFVGVKLYSAAFDVLEDETVHSDGTCAPAFQFKNTETDEVHDIQLIRIAALLGVSDDDGSVSNRRCGDDDWRNRYA